MSPFERMAEKYRLNPQEQSFEWYCDWHARYGFFYATPEFFVMGRPIRMSDGQAGIDAMTKRGLDNEGLCDTWYIHAFSGDMAKAWSILPWEMPLIAFERLRSGKRELTFVETERLKRLTSNAAQESILA